MRRTESGTWVVEDGAASVVIDDRAWPIVFATWFGDMTELLVDRYFEGHGTLIDRARSNRQKLVLVTDTFAIGSVSAKARKRIVDNTATQPKDAPALTLASFVVIESAMMRGVVTALAWIYPRMAESESVGTIGAAIDRSLAVLDVAKVARPKGLTPGGYRRPTKP